MAKATELNLPEIALGDGLTTQEHAYLRLRNAIMLGTIPPGANLTIRGLASYLGLSPTPIREAIRRLSSEQAVELKENRRITIPEMTAQRFEELVLLRIALETHAGRRALPHVSGILVDRLTALDIRMDAAIEDHRTDELTLLNHRFHRTLYETNPDQQVMPLIESTWLQLGPFHRTIVEQVKEYYLVDRHKEILAALRARDPDALAAAIENDIRDGIYHTGSQVLQRAG